MSLICSEIPWWLPLWAGSFLLLEVVSLVVTGQVASQDRLSPGTPGTQNGEAWSRWSFETTEARAVCTTPATRTLGRGIRKLQISETADCLKSLNRHLYFYTVWLMPGPVTNFVNWNLDCLKKKKHFKLWDFLLKLYLLQIMFRRKTHSL